MNRYKDYMDNLEVSDTLHEKLKHLEEPKKKPRPWAKYGAAAAALVLVAGVVAWGVSRDGWGALMENFRPAAEVLPEIAEIPAPDIAFVDPNGPFADPDGPADKTGGGYEVVHGDKDDPNTMVSYYLLPYLNWADVSALPQTSLNYSLAPAGAVQRDATWDDVLLFTGGEKAMADHLLWDGLNWDGSIFWFLEDGTPCAAGLSARGENLAFYLEVRKGHEVPSCVVLPDEYYETSIWQGTEITAVKNGGYTFTDDGVELAEKREVSFFCGGVGCKLTLYAVNADWANELCARFVRYAVAGGFRLDALSADGTAPVYAGPASYSVIGPHYGDGVPDEDGGDFYCDCPDCIIGTVHTHPYDPAAPQVPVN